MNRFVLHGHEVDFHPEGVVVLPETGTLVVADVHLGKAAAFRAGGVPVPEGDAARDLARLDGVAKETRAREIVVAGDLFHSATGLVPEIEEAFSAFLVGVGIPVCLVMGNHDWACARMPEGLVCVNRLQRGGIDIVHDPQEAQTAVPLSVCGHWHPVLRIPDGRRTALRLACFWCHGNRLILPAFGGFTGGSILQPKRNDRVMVALRDQVVEWPLGAGI
jgi:uncharacterized protein